MNSITLSSTACEANCPQLTQLEQQYSSLLSRFSHEIRNPLTLINSSLQLMEKDCPQVLSSSLWSQLRGDVSETIRLLQNMSALGKSHTVSSQPIHLTDFLSGIAASFRPAMLEHQIQFRLSIADELSGTLFYGDPLKLREVLTNLLVNAIDALDTRDLASPADDWISFGSSFSSFSAREISISATVPNATDLCIHVRDNGPGIPSAYLDSLFDMFVTHKSHGTGLGLAISRNIARQHGGTLTVSTSTDVPGSFADFCLQLPLYPS